MINSYQPGCGIMVSADKAGISAAAIQAGATADWRAAAEQQQQQQPVNVLIKSHQPGCGIMVSADKAGICAAAIVG
jgi:hypothetical protein